ncbi:MAG: formylglycine-generating enzyme family protein [Puniceicoccales bacterium]|jgi:formylglycine-generating enzyme required for sulfatase activity|nr:formylglycine-generating enzyme family protein [Puniceicoccales bacterium]
MPAQRISILGTESTGKTVLLAALTHTLSSAGTLPRITTESTATRYYTASVMDALELGNWPASTAAGTRKNLRWDWHDKSQDVHTLHTFDCAGQDFRAIFEAEFEADPNNDTPATRAASSELNAQQLDLRKEIFSSDLILLLFNLQSAVELRGKLEKNTARLELSFAPAAAIRRLCAAGIATYVIFTQADRYEKILQSEWGGDISRALTELLPQFYIALHDTGTPVAVVSAIETEMRNGALFPKVGCKLGVLANVVESIDNFLIKNKDAANLRYAENEKRKTADAWARERSEAIRWKKPFVIRFLNLEMRHIPAGAFAMGSPADEPERSKDETCRRVTLSKAFYLGKTAVTQGQWKMLMGNNPSSFADLGDSAPVENVSWDDAMEFCKKLTDIGRAAGGLPDGYIYTLPTEAQWEYACRAGTTGPFNTGLNLTTVQANYDGNYSYNGNAKGISRKRTVLVGTFQPNAWGFYEMHGNVLEWCLDWYGAYSVIDEKDPKGPLNGSSRILRGGSWLFNARSCRSAHRASNSQSYRDSIIGFRLALVSTAG